MPPWRTPTSKNTQYENLARVILPSAATRLAASGPCAPVNARQSRIKSSPASSLLTRGASTAISFSWYVPSVVTVSEKRRISSACTAPARHCTRNKRHSYSAARRDAELPGRSRRCHRRLPCVGAESADRRCDDRSWSTLVASHNAGEAMSEENGVSTVEPGPIPSKRSCAVAAARH